MTDLSGKFDALQQQLTDQHNAMTTTLAVLETRLNEVETAVVALGGGKTLADIWAKPFELTGDTAVTFDTAPIVDAITALRGTGPENTLRSVNESIWNVAGPAPGKSLEDLWNKLDALFAGLGFGASPPASYSLSQWLTDNLDAGAGISMYNLIDGLYVAMAALQNNVGTPTGDATTTVLGRMLAIQNLLNSNLPALVACCEGEGAQFPSEDPADMSYCSNRYIQAGSFIDSNRSYAYWTAGNIPTDQVAIGNNSSYPPGTELTPITDWSDFRVWVSSDAPQCALDNTGYRYPTNQWLPLSGSGSFAFSVDSQYALNVQLCAPAPATIGYSFAENETFEKTTSYATRFVPDWTKYGLTFVSNATIGNDFFIEGDWGGWTWEIISGSDIQIVWGVPSTTSTNKSDAGTGTLPLAVQGQTTYLLAIVGQAGPFSIVLLPP